MNKKRLDLIKTKGKEKKRKEKEAPSNTHSMLLVVSIAAFVASFVVLFIVTRSSINECCTIDLLFCLFFVMLLASLHLCVVGWSEQEACSFVYSV